MNPTDMQTIAHDDKKKTKRSRIRIEQHALSSCVPGNLYNTHEYNVASTVNALNFLTNSNYFIFINKKSTGGL